MKRVPFGEEDAELTAKDVNNEVISKKWGFEL
jgi:hypothetical protein